MAKYKEWEVTTMTGAFRFRGDSKKLAHDHAVWLRDNRSFTDEYGAVFVSDNVDEKVRGVAVRFVGWADE